MTERKTVVIFGISSFLGSNIANYLKKDYRIIGTYHECKIEIDKVMTIQCNVLDRERVAFVIKAFKPDITIYAVGLFSVVIGHHQERLADSLNTVGAINVSEESERHQAKMFYLSSDQVFNGEDLIHHERDHVSPTTVTGKTKLSAEYYIEKNSLNYVILRCCSIYGRSINPLQQTWFEILENNLLNGKVSYLDDYLVQGYLDPIYIAHIIKLCVDSNTKNRLLQVTSKDFMTRLEFGSLYCKYFNGSLELIKKKNWSFPELEKRSESPDRLYFKMNGENAEDSFDVSMPTIEESLGLTFQKWGGEKNKDKRASQKNIGLSYI